MDVVRVHSKSYSCDVLVVDGVSREADQAPFKIWGKAVPDAL